MPTAGPQDRGKGILLILLIVSNVVLFMAWPWLRGLPLGADSTDPPMKSRREVSDVGPVLNPAGIYRNSVYLSRFFDAVREARGIFFLGTSETVPEFNLGAQLNDRNPYDPPLIVLPRKGMSPIHSALMFASTEREGLSIPPLVLIINLVYFTESHDVINDGWMGSAVRTPVFAYLNHRDVLDYVSPEVRSLFQDHFSLWTLLRPILMQEYLGNLLYLLAHQAPRGPLIDRDLPIQRYPFDGILPEYDEERVVHRGYRASDQHAQGRWQVRRVDDCRNLQGLSSTIPILRRQNVPVLLLILPINRTFYSFNGMDMPEFDRRYAALREAIRNLSKSTEPFSSTCMRHHSFISASRIGCIWMLTDTASWPISYPHHPITVGFCRWSTPTTMILRHASEPPDPHRHHCHVIRTARLCSAQSVYL